MLEVWTTESLVEAKNPKHPPPKPTCTDPLLPPQTKQKKPVAIKTNKQTNLCSEQSGSSEYVRLQVVCKHFC